VERALLARHRVEWLGGLAPFLLDQAENVHGMAFARGWLDRLEVGNLNPPFAEALANAPQTQLLRTLRIHRLSRVVEVEGYDVSPAILGMGPIGILAESRFLTNVRLFQLGAEHIEDEEGLVVARDSEIVALVRRFPRLEEFYLHAHMRPGELYSSETFSRLRVLSVRGPADDVDVIAENPALRRLTRLSIAPNDRAEITVEAIRALLHSRHLRRLTHLRLHRCENGDRVCRMVVRSRLLSQLKELGLINCRITNRGAAYLAACESIPGLDLLDLSENFLGRSGVARLAAIDVNYLVDNQRRPDDYYDGVQE
jgi:hypothetical protein